MIGIGCVLPAASLVGLVCWGMLIGARQGGSGWLGAAAGFVTWLALMVGYFCLLTIYDWWDRQQHPKRIGVPWWGILVAWLFFAAAIAGAFLLWHATVE